MRTAEATILLLFSKGSLSIFYHKPVILPLMGLVLGAIFWLIDGVVDFVFFNEDGSAFHTILFSPEPMDLWMRSLVIIILLTFAFISKKILLAEMNAKLELESYKTELERKVDERTHEIQVRNEELGKEIAARKQAVAEIIEAKIQAEQANKAKSQFLSNMSHELRTPLNAILGFGQVLEMDIGSNSPDQQESIKYILTAGHQLLGLVNDLLDFSCVDIGKLDLNTQPLCIANLTSSCTNQVAAAIANQMNVTIDNMITDTSILVQGDDLRLRQVLINLLSNAVKYNKKNGWVRISSMVKKEGWLRIEVRDSGEGIASDKLALLFTPFERIDQKHGSISGLGIGLHITKQLVEAMHGTVGVESVQGKGSIFWFDLPLTTEAHKPTLAPEKTGQPIPLADSRFVVLYIEDNPANVQLVERALQSRPGIELLTAGTAEEGLAIAEEVLPRLILMDIKLPGVNGITATILLKGNAETKDIPVVALSAGAMKEDIDRALSSGCCAYLTKPFELQALYEVIDRMRLAENSDYTMAAQA